ncbi:MAG: alpha-2-macroglobulin family protein [Verrucomicrobiales bacterium]
MKLPSLRPLLLGALLLLVATPMATVAQTNRPQTRIAPPQPPPSPVVWSSTQPALTQETTIELRFPVPMVTVWGDDQATEEDDSRRPITVTPPLRGRWSWRSSESGVFVPLEEPVRGQPYSFAVRPGLADATGGPLPMPQPTLSLKAPGLSLIDRHPRWFGSHNLTRLPQILLQFNAPVNASTAGRQIHFVNQGGARIRSIARVATFANLPTGWELPQNFRQKALMVAGAADTTAPPESTLALPGTLIVTPAEPLPVGNDWKIEISGVRTLDGKGSLEQPSSFTLGNIEPLKLAYDFAENEIGRPKIIRLAFNKPLAPEIAAEAVVQHVSLQPEPTGYKANFENGTLTLAGEFRHQTPYTVTLAPGLTAADGLTMSAPYRKEFSFEVVTPVVALPGFSMNQLPQGRAVFDVHTVNVEHVRVRVKIADRESLIYALRAYRHYHESDGEGAEDEETGGARRIPFDAMPGQKIFEQEFSGTAPIDDQDEFVIDWRQALNGRKAGALFVSVEGQARPEWTGKKRRFGAQAFVQLTDIGLAWKLSAEEVFVSLFSQATGKPMSGVALTVFDAEKNTLGQATTAEDGTARLPRAHASWLLAESQADLHAVELDGPGAQGLGMWRFGVPFDWGQLPALRHHVSVFTERPVYLPGHTVYFKAIGRLIDATGTRKPTNLQPALLKAYDSKGRLIHRRDVQFSAAGSLDGSLELPPGPLGPYRLEIEVPHTEGGVAAGGDEDAEEEAEEDADDAGADSDPEDRSHRPLVFHTSFFVEEYKPNTFKTTFDDPSFTLVGENASLNLQSRYLLGKPLAKAKLLWSASVSRGGFDSPAFPQHAFLDSRETYYWDAEGYHEVPVENVETHLVTAQARTDLSDDGRATLEFPVPTSPFAALPRTVAVTAEVTDLNQQTIAERWQRTLHPSSYYLGIRRLEDIVASGEPLDIALAAARTDGQSWPDPVEAQVMVEKIDFVTVRVQTVGGGSNVRTEIQRGVVAEATVTVPPGRHESAAYKWSPKEPGFYYITARSTDPEGRAVQSVTSVQVHGEGWASWYERDGVRIELTPDKTSYRHGETAKILVKSPLIGRAMVCLERRHVIRHFFTDITSNSQVVEVPLEAGLAPNTFVSVFIVRGAETSPRRHKSTDYKVGFTELRIVDERSRLNVAVAAQQPSYRPGDQGTATATVTDHSGAPVVGAEVTFWAADDGVLTLVPYEVPDLWSAFHQPQVLAVVTGSSLMALLPEDPQELAFTNKGYMIGGGADGESASGERLRRNFQPVAFFQGALVTDQSGQITVPFAVPDNLTRFRLVAVATAGDDAFGSGEGGFEINKPLMLEPALPRFAHVGDRITAKGIVLNHTDQPLETEVTLTLDSLATASQPLVQRVTLDPHGTAAVAFPLEFTEAGSAVWQWKAASVTPGIALADAVQSTLAIGYAQPVLTEMRYAILKSGDDPENLLATVNPELLQGRGEVTVTVSNSILLEAAGAFAYLLHYPYGCLEQTSSSLMPWLALRQLDDPASWAKRPLSEIDRTIQSGANRLLSMQTTDGGFSYWPGERQSSQWTSAYGGMVLAMARTAGAQVPEERVNGLAGYLSNSLRRSQENTDPSTLYDRAFACFTLALLGRGEPAYHEVLARKTHALSHSGRALLALAILESGGSREQAVKVLDDPQDAALQEWQHPWLQSHLTPLNLLVWLKIDPTHATTAALTERLLKERTSHGRWRNTSDNAWAFLALTTAARSFNQHLAEVNLEIAFADQTAKVSLPASPASRSVTLPFNGQGSARQLTVHGTPPDRIRVAVAVAARPKVVPLTPRNQGFGISRKYAKLLPDGSTVAPENLEIGDLVAVTLDLRLSKPGQYIAVDDPLPAILEAINPKFVSQAPGAARPPGANQELIIPWWSSHEELRHDRALFFADHLWAAGTYRLSYLTRVVAEGMVTAPPAKIEAMYEPAQYGLSGTQLMSARTAAESVAGQK